MFGGCSERRGGGCSHSAHLLTGESGSFAVGNAAWCPCEMPALCTGREGRGSRAGSAAALRGAFHKILTVVPDSCPVPTCWPCTLRTWTSSWEWPVLGELLQAPGRLPQSHSAYPINPAGWDLHLVLHLQHGACVPVLWLFIAGRRVGGRRIHPLLPSFHLPPSIAQCRCPALHAHAFPPLLTTLHYLNRAQSPLIRRDFLARVSAKLLAASQGNLQAINASLAQQVSADSGFPQPLAQAASAAAVRSGCAYLHSPISTRPMQARPDPANSA